MTEEQKRSSGIGGIGDGIRTGIGILSAIREAIEETFDEAVKRGDLSPDRARQAMSDVAERIQGTVEGARERLDFVSRREYEELRVEVDRLRERLARLEGSGSAPEAPGIIITE